MSKEKVFRDQIKKVYKLLMYLLIICALAGIGLTYCVINPACLVPNSKADTLVAIPLEIDEDLIENGIHIRTGLINAEGLMVVVNNCTNCHSSKLVMQNRMSAEGWNETIEWMQETQNLWDLGGNQKIIVDYLVTNYPSTAKGRRMALTDIDWYELED